MKLTQLEFVKNELMTNGFISRNHCLRNYISRLGARINDLKNEGWQFEAKNIKTEYGTDYVYYHKRNQQLNIF